MVEQIAPELVERISSCLEIVASMKPGARLGDFWEAVDEAKAIVADLPKPVDPDLIEARKIAADCFRFSGQHADASATERGLCDGWSTVRAALTTIKHTRFLARTDQETAHV